MFWVNFFVFAKFAIHKICRFYAEVIQIKWCRSTYIKKDIIMGRAHGARKLDAAVAGFLDAIAQVLG